jgi:hypothetical protein
MERKGKLARDRQGRRHIFYQSEGVGAIGRWGVRGSETPSFPKRPERQWRAFPGAPCPGGARKFWASGGFGGSGAGAIPHSPLAPRGRIGRLCIAYQLVTAHCTWSPSSHLSVLSPLQVSLPFHFVLTPFPSVSLFTWIFPGKMISMIVQLSPYVISYRIISLVAPITISHDVTLPSL